MSLELGANANEADSWLARQLIARQTPTRTHTRTGTHSPAAAGQVLITPQSRVCLCGQSSGGGDGTGRTESRSCERVSSVAPECFCIRSVFVLATLLSMMVLNYVWAEEGVACHWWVLVGEGLLRVV